MPADDIQGQIVKYLEDVHSTEQNAITQLKAGAEAVEHGGPAALLRRHLAESEEHERLTRERLEALGASPSGLKDVVQKGVAAVTGVVSGSAPDTTGKIAIQAFAFEHLEIASYRSLRAAAQLAGDQETVALAARILAEEEAAAQGISDVLEDAAITGLPQTAS